MLRKRHGSGIKPAVDNLRHTSHGPLTFRAGAGDLVNIRTVQLHGHRRVIAAHLLQLLPGTDALHMAAAFALPDVQRRTPVTVPADAPVLDVLQPVAEAALADALRDPVDRIVVADQIFLYRRHLDKPGFSRIVDERRAASPAVGIAVLEFGCVEQQFSRIQIFQHLRVRLLHEQARKWRVLRHVSFAVHQLYKRKIVFAAHVGVVLTESRGDVHDAGTVGQGDVGIAGNIISFFALLLRHFCRAVKERFVLLVLQVLSGIALQHLVSGRILRAQFPQHRVKQRLRHIVDASVRRLYFHIGFHRIDAERHVGRQRPGGGGPCQDIGVLVLYFEAHHS